MKQNIIRAFCVLAIILPIAYCGKAVISGGDIASDNAALYQSFIDLSTVNGQHKIGVVTNGISWSISESIAKQIRNRLIKFGAVAANVEWIPWHKDNGNSCTDPVLAAKVNEYTGIFFNGGTVSFFEDCFVQNGVDVPALVNIRTRYAANQLAILGSSAGALIVQGAVVPKTRESYTSLKSGATYSQEGWGLFEYGFIDVHVVTKGRQGRLVRMIDQMSQYGTTGFGVDDNTAMVVRGDEFEVVGQYGVYIFNLDDAINESAKRFKIRNVKATYLTNGDKYNFLTEGITFGTGKLEITTTQRLNSPALTSTDIFAQGVYNTLATSLMLSKTSTSTYGLTKETTPQYRIDFTRTSQSVGYGTGSPMDPNTVSYKNLQIDISCHLNC